MISYYGDHQDAILFKINPISKIFLLILVTVVITFDYKPFVPGIFWLTSLLLVVFLGKIPLKEVLKISFPFCLVAVGFILFTLLTRGFGGRGEVGFWIFSWNKDTVMISLALGLRILAIISYSILFVLTTNPVELVLSLIKYGRLPYKIGYSVLTAYRFLPTLAQELESISYAHQVRGAVSGTGIAGKLAGLKKYPIPLLATAIRRGERVAAAMEARAFGANPNRTYYKEVKLSWLDLAAVVSGTLFCIAVLLVLNKYGLLGLSLGFDVR